MEATDAEELADPTEEVEWDEQSVSDSYFSWARSCCFLSENLQYGAIPIASLFIVVFSWKTTRRRIIFGGNLILFHSRKDTYRIFGAKKNLHFD